MIMNATTGTQVNMDEIVTRRILAEELEAFNIRLEINLERKLKIKLEDKMDSKIDKKLDERFNVYLKRMDERIEEGFKDCLTEFKKLSKEHLDDLDRRMGAYMEHKDHEGQQVAEGFMVYIEKNTARYKAQKEINERVEKRLAKIESKVPLI